MKGRIQQRIDVAKDKGERLLEGVRNWLDKANDEILKVEEFLEEEANANKKCFNLQFCVDLGAVRRYSKIAKDKTYLLSQHLEDGNKHFETGVSVPIPAPSIVDLYQRMNLEHMNSQKFTLGKIIQALEDENIQTVGIYGLGGVGKTTISKEVAAKMKNQFAGIVFIVVSQTIDCKMIQDKVDVAAKRVINGEKVLIILDDVWEDLVLPDLGIPCGNDYMNYKILLTSRSKNVCEAMNVDSSICVISLTQDEAWILFKRVAGDRVETDVELRLIATEVTDECGGLPLIIQAIGNALRNKSVNLWEAALDRLKKHAPLDIAPEIRKAFTHLKLSYDLLESEEAKSCFLLCCMFKEDELIDLESLVEYGVGLGIFNNLDSIQDARHRVQIAVDTLKSSFLLLSIDDEVFMHEVVRDVALLITSKGKEKFLVMAGKELMEWKPRNNTSESYTKISLMHNKIRELPDNELYFPLLDTFLIQYNQVEIVPNEFFRAMKEVKVLDMSGFEKATRQEETKWERSGNNDQTLVNKLLTRQGNTSRIHNKNEVILEAHDLWEAIEPKEGAEVDNKKDKATTAFLYQALTEDVILQVAGCETAKELWESLKTRHVGEEKVQQARVTITNELGLIHFKMKMEDTVDAFTLN
ncbi:disease resistance protein-like protein [Tanacetum coccineum]